MSHFKLNICLSDIPKDKIFTSEKTGKKYIDVDLTELKQPFDDGTDYTLYYYDKETKEKTYCGKGKTWSFNGGNDSSTNDGASDKSDLPF